MCSMYFFHNRFVSCACHARILGRQTGLNAWGCHWPTASRESTTSRQSTANPNAQRAPDSAFIQVRQAHQGIRNITIVLSPPIYHEGDVTWRLLYSLLDFLDFKLGRKATSLDFFWPTLSGSECMKSGAFLQIGGAVHIHPEALETCLFAFLAGLFPF